MYHAHLCSLIANTTKTGENTFEQADANGERKLTFNMHILIIFFSLFTEIKLIHSFNLVTFLHLFSTFLSITISLIEDNYLMAATFAF